MGDLMFNMHQYVSQEKRQEVISSVYNLGTIKGKGSSTRIFNNCLNSTNDNVDACLSLIATGEIPLPVDNLLFDFDSFNGLVPINGKMDYIPDYIKEPLIAAANRWNALISLTPDIVKYIRSLGYFNRRQWKGLLIKSLNITTLPVAIANCSPEIIKNGTFIIDAFTLNVDQTRFTSDKSFNYRFNVLSHELGHALGFALSIIKSLDNGNGTELLPNIQKDVLKDKIETNPTVLIDKYYPDLIKSYNVYGGYNDGGLDPQPIPIPNKNIPIKGSHWYDTTLYGLPLKGSNYYRGFYNEIMVPTAVDNLLISSITKNTLLAMYSIINGKKIYNYVSKKAGSEVNGYDYQNGTDLIIMKGTIPKSNMIKKDVTILHEHEQEEDFMCGGCLVTYSTPEDNFCQVIPPKRTFNNMFTSLK